MNAHSELLKLKPVFYTNGKEKNQNLSLYLASARLCWPERHSSELVEVFPH